ncbi:MAG TPA: pyridoxal-phosphate dependent enzyme, partial [Savagea sp.]
SYFKEKELDEKIVAVEPEDSAVLSTGVAGAHKIQGIGAGFVPSIYESDLVDEIVTVTNEEAFAMARMLAEKEGLLLGISSAAAIKASINLALKEKLEDQRIVVIAPDTGERYLSTPVFKKD